MLDDDIDLCCDRLNSIIMKPAEESIPKSEGKGRMKVVPWWNEDCNKQLRKEIRCRPRLGG